MAYQDFVEDFGKLVLKGKHTDPKELWNAAVTIIASEVKADDSGGCCDYCTRDEYYWAYFIKGMRQ